MWSLGMIDLKNSYWLSLLALRNIGVSISPSKIVLSAAGPPRAVAHFGNVRLRDIFLLVVFFESNFG